MLQLTALSTRQGRAITLHQNYKVWGSNIAENTNSTVTFSGHSSESSKLHYSWHGNGLNPQSRICKEQTHHRHSNNTAPKPKGTRQSFEAIKYTAKCFMFVETLIEALVQNYAIFGFEFIELTMDCI